VTKFTAVFHPTGCFRYILGRRGNSAGQFARVRKRRYSSRRHACIQSEVGPRKSSYGSGGALLAPQQGPRRNHGQNQTFETLP